MLKKRNKLILFLSAFLFVGYLGFYYHVTHDFKADITVNPFIVPAVADQFKTDAERAAYTTKRINDSNHCTLKYNPCRDEVGFFINPYARQRSLIACEGRLRTFILTRFINDPDYDCRLKPPQPMKKK